MTMFGFLLIYSLALFGAWTVGCKVRDWLNRAEQIEYPTPPPDTPWPKEVVAKRQPRKRPADLKDVYIAELGAERNTRPTTQNGKTARKRSTKSGK